MSDSSIRFGRPQKVGDLKTARLWSLDFSSQLEAKGDEFRFFVVEKVEDGYLLYGQADSASDAFRLRKTMAEELGAKLFIRAKRFEQRQLDAYADDDGALDFFRDKFNEGVSVADIPRHLRRDYQQFCRTSGRSAR